jgi:hypothetical protein
MNGIKPTSRKSSNIIDLVICSDNLIQRINDITSLTESDHWPVSYTLDFNPAKSTIKKIDWKLFQLDMSQKFKSNPETIESISDLEFSAIRFSEDILISVNDNTYIKETSNYKCHLPQCILELKLKKRLQRYYSRTHDRRCRCCESLSIVFIDFTRGCKNISINLHKNSVGCLIQLIIGLIPNFSLCILARILKLPALVFLKSLILRK